MLPAYKLTDYEKTRPVTAPDLRLVAAVDVQRRSVSVITLVRFFYLLVVMMLALPNQAVPQTRIKDIANFEGVRENILVGYGLVVGLNGTGDKLNNTAFTEQSLMAFLERLGVNTRGKSLKSKNVAAVTVTANLPPFARQGAKIDVTISALGDAKSLQGGTLLATPLLAADGEVYAVAQGEIATGGFSAGGASGSSITKNIPTRGAIASGAIVERETSFVLNDMNSLNISLKNPDLTTATSVAQAINARIGGGNAAVLDPSTVRLNVPDNFHGNVAGLLASIEQLKVSTDQPAKIVIDEASGTVVMGENVKIDTVAVSQGNLVVRVDESIQISQPNPFAPDGAQTAAVPQTDLTVDEGVGHVAIFKKNSSLKDLVDGLNSLGVAPRDLITILHTIKAAGALQAEIETR